MLSSMTKRFLSLLSTTWGVRKGNRSEEGGGSGGLTVVQARHGMRYTCMYVLVRSGVPHAPPTVQTFSCMGPR